jgi:hypothetical protein
LTPTIKPSPPGSARHSATCPHARSITRRPSATIRPVSSAIGTKSAGSIAARAVPPGQRLEADDAARRDLHERLVGDLDPVGLDRVAQVGLEIQPAHHDLVHVRVEDRVAALAFGLRAVHRDVGVAHHVGRSGVGVGERDPDRRGHDQLAPVEVERILQRLLDALGDHGRLAGVADVVEQDRELVAAEPGDGVAGAQGRLQPARDRDQQPVADVVPERVVDELEAVEVEEQHGGAGVRVPALRAADRLREAVEEEHAVRQPGQRVVQRVVLQALLGLAAVGDVGLGADHARRAPVLVAHRDPAREHPPI